MTFDDVVFPEEFEIVSNSTDVINQAQIIIPGSIILHQFEIEGIQHAVTSFLAYSYILVLGDSKYLI